MSEQMLIRYCSPTLAGIKTGNIFTCTYTESSKVKEYIRSLNRRMRSKGLRVLPLRDSGQRVLIYVYRPSRLSRDLEDIRANEILNGFGYPCMTPGKRIPYLISRLKECDEFPHEIGLFLGYPPEDVSGFIENKPGSCKLTGIWKVYGNAEKARLIFDKYKKCTDVYGRCWAAGRSLESLTVAG